MKPVYDKKRTHMTRGIMTTAKFPLELPSPEVGEGNSKFKYKKIRKIQIHQYGQIKGCYRVFLGMLSPNLASPVLC